MRLLGQAAVGCGVRRDPLEPLFAVLRLGEPEQRGQQQPLTAAVIGVVEVAVDAAAGTDERRHVDRPEAEEGEDEQASVQPLLRAGEIEVVAEPRGDAGERGGVHALALLPPVDARLLAHALEVGRGRRGRVPPPIAAAVPGGVLPQRPEPEAPAVVLAVRPLARIVLALQRVAGLEAETALDDPRHPVEERLCALDLADPAHRVRDEGAVAEPGVAVGREARAGRVAAARRLAGSDRLDAGAPEVSEIRYGHR